MILLQFGGNVIPYLTNDYDYYERLFKRELGVIRRMLPGTPVSRDRPFGYVGEGEWRIHHLFQPGAGP